MLRLLLVDEDAAVREGVRAWLALDAGLKVVSEAADGVQTLMQVRVYRPDVVVMNVALPLLDGPATAEVLRATQPRCAVVLYSLTDRPAWPLTRVHQLINLTQTPAVIFETIYRVSGRVRQSRRPTAPHDVFFRWSSAARST